MNRTLDRHSAFFNLQEALPEPGCPLCRLKKRWTDSFLETILYESVNDKFFRSRLAKSEGFCHTHAWRIVECNSALGGAILFKDALDRLLSRIGEKKITKVKGLTPCLLCENELEAESRYLNVMAAALAEDSAFHSLFQASDGLCFPHLELLLEQLSPKVRPGILALHREKYGRLSAGIGAFIEKFDYRNQDRVFTEEEKNSWKNAARITVRENGTVAR